MLVLGNSYHSFPLYVILRTLLFQCGITSFRVDLLLHPVLSMTIALFHLMQMFYKDEVLTVLAVYIIIPSAVFLELLVCKLAVKLSMLFMIRGISDMVVGVLPISSAF